MIDVVSGSLSKGKDWAQVWLESEEYKKVSQEVDDLVDECASKPPSFEEDGKEYATPMSTQFKLVIARSNLSMWRSTDVSTLLRCLLCLFRPIRLSHPCIA